MLIRTEPGVVATVLPSGRLELYRPRTGERFQCCPAGAAVWIALRQHQGRFTAAADMLARIWQADPDRTQCDMRRWAGEFRDAGLIVIEP